MLKKLLLTITAIASIGLLATTAYAQVFSQYQLINPPLGGGVVVSTSTANGAHLGTIATSSLGLLTTNVAEGSNLYFTTARDLASFITNLAATTSVASITTLPNLALPLTQTTGTLAINRGGTNTTSQTTNGVNYFDGTKITSGSTLIWDGTNLTAPGLQINAGATNLGSFTQNGSSGLITALNGSPADPSGSSISAGANFGFNGSPSNFYGMGLGAIRNGAYDMWFQTGPANGGGFRWYTGTTENMTLDKTGKLTIEQLGSGLVKSTSGLLADATNGTDYTLVTANTCGAGQFFNSATAAGVFGCGTPAGTTYTGTFPIQVTGSVISFGGLSTSSPLVSGQPTYATGINTIASVASSTFLSSIGGQASGNYLTALTGDGTASGPGSAALTLATVNSNLGTFNNITINAKGLATAGSNVAYDTFGYPFPSSATSTPLTFTGLITTVNASTTLFSSSYASSTNAFFGTLNLPLLTGTQCLHEISGVVSGTGSDCGSGSGGVTSVTGTYPVQSSGGTTPTISLAFGTTTANVWQTTQTFTVSPVFSTLGAGTVNVTAAGTIYNTATSTVSLGSGLTYTGTMGSEIGGVSGSLSVSGLTTTNFSSANISQWTNDSGYLTSAVTSAIAGTGIGVSGATGAVTFSNTGVTSIVAGTNITISGATGAVTINASGGGGAAYPFTPSTDGGIATSATTTPIEGAAIGLGLDVPVTSWFGLGGKLLTYASSTNQDTLLGFNTMGNIATTSSTTHEDTAIGFDALQKVTVVTNQNDAAVGYEAGQNLTSGINNTAVGAQSLNVVTSGSSNAAFGFQAGANATAAASNNTFLGYEADDGAASGAMTSVTIVGSVAGGSNSGNQNTYIGAQAGVGGTTGSQNVALGYDGALPVASGSGQLNIQNIIYGSGNTGTGITLSTGRIGIGTTTPFSKFAIQANNGETNTTLFAIGSSTSSGNNALFSVSNAGQTIMQGLGLIINDVFGTNILQVNTASTTGSIFTVAATTSPNLGAGAIKLFDIDQYGHMTASSTFTPSVSTCGTSPTLSASSNDVTGTINVGTGTVTGCTLTFGSPYITAPTVVVSDNSTGVVPDVSAISTTAFTASFSGTIAGGKIYYIVMQP